MKYATLLYQELSQRTNTTDTKSITDRLAPHQTQQILHAGIGLATESGEVLDQIKKHVYYGKELDKVNLIEEAGDVLWYVATLLEYVGSTFEEAMDKNIQKLETRFPEGFTKDKALNRDLKTERTGLES